MPFWRLNNISGCLFFILIFIGFQQFPVINVGGSLKIYELLGLFLLCLYGIGWGKNILIHLLFFFFVLSPIMSLLSFYLMDAEVSSFYRAYPVVKDKFRFNIFIFPFLQLLYMLTNYTVCYYLYFDRKLYRNFETVKKWMVIVGFWISVYSLISMFTVDVVTKLPEFIQNKHGYEFRSSGFSQEPSSYVLYQGWIVLITFYSKNSFSRIKWIVILVVNVLSLLLTFSSSLIAFVGVIMLMVFIFSKPTYKFFYISLLVASLYVGYHTLSRYMDVGMLNYAFVEKVEDFVFGKDDAGGSGGFRHYEASLGWIMFKHNPVLGVGVGNSVYYMHEAARESPIVPMGEQLHPGSFPPNLFSSVFSEQGVLGGALLLLIMGYICIQIWKYRNEKYGKLFLAGTLFNMSSFFAIAPVYSMYLWVFVMMALGYIRYQKENKVLRLILSK